MTVVSGHTFREVDEALQLPKGTAFRAFRKIESSLHEGTDFSLLRSDEDGDTIRSLRSSGRIYRASVNAVLVSDSVRQRIEQMLRSK
jgi:hypothetical protein